MTAYIINDSDILKQINVEFQFEQGVNWSKYDDFDLGQYVQINRDFRWPQIGATKFDILKLCEQSQNIARHNRHIATTHLLNVQHKT